MSYPFGFSRDYHGYLFRSVFFPVVLLALAVLVAGASSSQSAPQSWNLVLLAVFFSSLPSPFHFEFKDSDLAGYFGLVDNFFAGVAALAAAFMLRSARTRSLRGVAMGALLSTLCLLIKPAGMIVMAVLAIGWGIAVLVGMKSPATGFSRRDDFRFLFRGTLLILLIEAAVVLACTRSRYLSAETISAGKNMMKIMHGELAFSLSFALIHEMLRVSVGYPVVVMLVLLLFLLAFYKTVFKDQVPSLLAAILVLMAGLWFWIVETGGNQVRFFVPFAAMTFVWLVPAILQVAERLPNWGRNLLLLFWIIPAGNLALLLHSSPNPVWQNYSGVTINIGQNDALVAQAETVLLQARKKGRDLSVYALDTSAGTAALLSVGLYNHSIDPAKPSFDVKVPVTWVSSTGYNLRDLLKSRYVVFVPVLDSQEIQANLARNSADNFWQEYALFHSWFSTLNENDGVHEVSETSSRLIEITDPQKLQTSLANLIKSRSWRPLFHTINSDLEGPPTALERMKTERPQRH